VRPISRSRGSATETAEAWTRWNPFFSTTGFVERLAMGAGDGDSGMPETTTSR
jgi:hypothetical protein